MVESIQNIFIQFSDFLWSYIIISVLIFCAAFFTWRTRFVQFRLIKEMVRLLLHPDKVQPEEIGHDELSMDVKVDGEMKHISSFQAFVVALASRIGTGNLAGVATAISIGGPGAVFWMWMLALLGSASAFIESTLAQLYKRKGKTSFYGGPAYYMKYGLGKGWMGILFAVLMIITFGFAYNSVQSNTICLAWQKAFGFEPATMGIVLTALTLLIIFGGIQRVGKILFYRGPSHGYSLSADSRWSCHLEYNQSAKGIADYRGKCFRIQSGCWRYVRYYRDSGH